MTRRLLNLLTALSLLLCVAACVLWARSYWRSDAIWWTRQNIDDPYPRKSYFAETVTGEFECGRADLLWWRYESWEWTGSVPDQGFSAESRPSRGYASASSSFANETELGCWLHRTVAGVDLHFADVPQQRVWRIGFPLWMVAVATAVLPGLHAAARLRRAKRPGLCPSCGYDLRATPERCPECGQQETRVAP